MNKAKRTPWQSVVWWWNTRIRALWTVLLPSLKEKATSDRQKFNFERNASAMVDSENKQVTAILTVYKRSQFLRMQIQALREQTVPPDEIWVWCNENDQPLEDFSAIADRVICSNSNWKFWGRFSIAALARTKYVAIIDDDILPRPGWIENCIKTVEQGADGILGGSGAILPASGGYSSKNKIGWNGLHSDTVQEVDVVCQTWFFSKKHLQYLWVEQPYTWENGEDIHFAYSAQKYGGVKSYIPPHPEHDQDLWSCLPDFGKMANTSTHAVHKSDGHRELRSAMVDKYRQDGWSLLTDES